MMQTDPVRRQFIGIEEQAAFVEVINERVGLDYQQELFV
jgi:hypothetical protein